MNFVTLSALLIASVFAFPQASPLPITAPVPTDVNTTTTSFIHFQKNYTIDFAKDQKHYNGSVYQGIMKQGEQAVVQYDLSRALCKHSFGEHGVDTWTVSMVYQFNGHHKNKAIIFAAAQLPEYQSPLINLVEGGDLQMWFVCTSDIQTTYDSEFGANFHFKVLPSLS